MTRFCAFLLGMSLPFGLAAQSTFSVKLMTPETALKAALAAQKKCRDSGFQATIAVVDRSGVVQVLLRDRFAGPHTTDMAVAKAYTAVSFRTDTTALAEARSRAGRKAASATGRASPRSAAA